MEAFAQDTRRNALRKIAAIACTFETSDLERLSAILPKSQPNGVVEKAAPGVAVPLSLKELEALLALCDAASELKSRHSLDAEKLLRQLCLYLPDAHAQAITPSPFLKNIEPCPGEALTFNLTNAVLVLGINHPAHRTLALDASTAFLENCLNTAATITSDQHFNERGDGLGATGQFVNAAVFAVALLGFLEGAAKHASFWAVSERLRIIDVVRQILSEKLLVAVETVLSTIRNSPTSTGSLKDWRRYTRHYAAMGRPLGAMLLQESFMKLLVSFSSLAVLGPTDHAPEDFLDYLMSESRIVKSDPTRLEDATSTMAAELTEISMDEMSLLEDGADFLQLGSTWQQKVAFAVKASVLTTFLNCVILNDEIADADVLMEWLEDTLGDSLQMADERLASVVLKCMAVLARISPVFASNLSRTLPRFIVQGGSQGRTIAVAAQCLASVLRMLSQDAVITTLYTLGNVLSSGGRNDRAIAVGAVNGNAKVHQPLSPYDHQTSGSAISLTLSGEEEMSVVHGNVIQAIVGVARSCRDDKITALAQSMLIQKIGKVSAAVDARMITEATSLAQIGGQMEFKGLLRFYARTCHEAFVKNDTLIVHAVMRARNELSLKLKKDSALFDIYIVHLLETIITKGDVQEGGTSNHDDFEMAAQEIARLIQPLALLIASNFQVGESMDDGLIPLCRDAWFNIVVHGFMTSSNLGKLHYEELKTLAVHFHPLVGEQRADQLESDFELNTILRRGMTAQHTAEQKKVLISLLPNREAEVKSLSYTKVIFLRAAYLMESLRADSGDCTKLLFYFLDASLSGGPMGICMTAIGDRVMSIYLDKALNGNFPGFSAPHVAKQLVDMFSGCCHRVQKVQQIAVICADKIVKDAPSALCQKSSLFALLELLTIMWSSCLEAETDEYEWKSKFSSLRGQVSVELSDDYAVRRNTLNTIHQRAKSWVMRVMNIAPLDVKGLLQTYLSDYDDAGAYGHLSLGRSFAVEMGSAVPITDQRLGAIERHGEYTINTASDFIAQYTTRQEYRHADALSSHDQEWMNFMQMDGRRFSTATRAHQDSEDAQTILSHLEDRVVDGRFVSIAELRDVLRRAAALLCRTKSDQCAIVHHLVGIPFALFTKQSIKLGISLWLGVIHENPRMETRILVEIAECWETTVRKKMGIFEDDFRHTDPFFLKEEFAPSDKGLLLKRQESALNLIGPHLRLLQFLGSHFNSIRLGSLHMQRVFHRFLRITLDGLKSSTGHPLAREVHFHIILLGLKILRYSTGLDDQSQERLKEHILSAALAWFSSPPRWSFGGNRLQIKAETHLLADVEAALQVVAHIGSTGSRRGLRDKEELLLMLLSNEQTRLIVWLFPLDHRQRHHFASGNSRSLTPTDSALSASLRTAWAESPALAIQLVNRFQSVRLASDVRWLLVNFPERAIGVPDALQILLDASLPDDLSFQLKYLLYWSPVNPVTAVTYFLPAYGNHPFILQYAMRALESHSVDVTFFYVPQIVQTLRYDVLGYVERYILETAKFSQLFAHQIIWNMKANAFKDEDSEVPDPLKPTLDAVTASLISSFSGNDKAFFQKEFAFFNEVTDISGKLRPYIKKSKPEKRQKIEEELRKIKVETGVYLPSNPEGVVIGIDRKSGKPLQSHAKAPFMATFRIRKSKPEMQNTENVIGQIKHDGAIPEGNTVELWQSAIFKVGDDCRQDVLALQMIAAFRGIFNDVGLDVFVYPYRVTATAPGCGVIDVLPNSISRDMLGREAVNGLYDYFVSRFGGEDSIRFQEARNNFVKSMAAYSIISYLLQFKDRHNGNIMVDDAGHILHIDFGFCFDIAPGGIKFERAPFKLTSEMVAVMGGSTESQSFRWFEELCIKAFLAARPYTEKLVHIVMLMLDSGLPCFKPETIQHFRERFVLEKSESDATDFMRDLVRKSYNSYSTKGYDQFQLLTNGIPY
ncbi:MAG: phosphatidylinositol-4- kinase [Piccolia ochrophora]|nr:MAG: phosphatidylinositol-4- kinase [Piccolia ochrophora]